MGREKMERKGGMERKKIEREGWRYNVLGTWQGKI